MEMSVGEIIMEAFRTSDSCGQSVVLILLVASAILWGIIITKFLELNGITKLCRRFMNAFQDCKGSPLVMLQRFGSAQKVGGVLQEICDAGIGELLQILDVPDFEQRNFIRHGCLPRKLDGDEIEKIRATMNRIGVASSARFEENMTILGTLVTISPLLGLFGTVWGVMVTFIGIAQEGRPDIATIAPGISGALLTTVGGLVVAIPALFCNNCLSAKLEKIYGMMDSFIEQFISSLRLEETAIMQEGAQMPKAASNPVPSPAPSPVQQPMAQPAPQYRTSQPTPPPMSPQSRVSQPAPQASPRPFSSVPASAAPVQSPRPVNNFIKPDVPPPSSAFSPAQPPSSAPRQQVFSLSDDEDN